jgi:molybdenum cofactor synthesis domain-containing protein
LDLVLTSGGTGFSRRDVTPDATLAIVEKTTPGIPEAIRLYGLQKTPKAMLSRAAAGIRGNTLIINLPGSVKGVRESLEAVFPALVHGLEILAGSASECGQE